MRGRFEGITSASSLERAALAAVSRRQFLRRSAGVLGGVAGLGLLDPTAAFGGPKAAPVPIPGGLKLTPSPHPVASDPDIHVIFPYVGNEMSTITDFNGVVAAGEIQGSANGSDGSTWQFDADMRFMEGLYRGTDGRVRHGSFGFV